MLKFIFTKTSLKLLTQDTGNTSFKRVKYMFSDFPTDSVSHLAILQEKIKIHFTKLLQLSQKIFSFSFHCWLWFVKNVWIICQDLSCCSEIEHGVTAVSTTSGNWSFVLNMIHVFNCGRTRLIMLLHFTTGSGLSSLCRHFLHVWILKEHCLQLQ